MRPNHAWDHGGTLIVRPAGLATWPRLATRQRRASQRLTDPRDLLAVKRAADDAPRRRLNESMRRGRRHRCRSSPIDDGLVPAAGGSESLEFILVAQPEAVAPGAFANRDIGEASFGRVLANIALFDDVRAPRAKLETGAGGGHGFMAFFRFASFTPGSSPLDANIGSQIACHPALPSTIVVPFNPARRDRCTHVRRRPNLGSMEPDTCPTRQTRIETRQDPRAATHWARVAPAARAMRWPDSAAASSNAFLSGVSRPSLSPRETAKPHCSHASIFVIENRAPAQ
jgi:hypothetical protein